MTFSESTKLEVKRRANFTCCWCQDKRNKIQVHHIIPEAEGGSDDEDNAAPLCGSCHELLGTNPYLRKEIKAKRNHWYETCDKRMNSEKVESEELKSQLKSLAHRIEFARWQTEEIRSINLHIMFKEIEESARREPEHFRACLELQSVVHEKRSIILGGQDDYWRAGKDSWYLGTKTFFFRQRFGNIEDSWIPQGPRSGGGYIDGLHFRVRWLPVSDILAAEFDRLALHFHFTENLLDRIAKVKFTIDSYVFIDREIRLGSIDYVKPSLGWPNPLTEEQANLKWRFCDFGWIRFDNLPKVEDQ